MLLPLHHILLDHRSKFVSGWYSASRHGITLNYLLRRHCGQHKHKAANITSYLRTFLEIKIPENKIHASLLISRLVILLLFIINVRAIAQPSSGSRKLNVIDDFIMNYNFTIFSNTKRKVTADLVRNLLPLLDNPLT